MLHKEDGPGSHQPLSCPLKPRSWIEFKDPGNDQALLGVLLQVQSLGTLGETPRKGPWCFMGAV